MPNSSGFILMFLAQESDFDLVKPGPTEALQWPWRGIQPRKIPPNVGHRCIRIPDSDIHSYQNLLNEMPVDIC